MRKSIQFELWRECDNLCKMCFLGLENRITPIKTKIQSLKDAIQNVKEFKGDIIAIIGGEFFQGQLNDTEVKTLFYDFIDLVIDRLNTKSICSAWVTATLTRKKPEDLLYFINYVKEKWNGNGSFIICTSYDLIGRFHTNEKKLNWEENMKIISQIDNRIGLNTTMILSNALVKAYLNNEMDFLDFTNKYNTSLMIKHPNRGPYGTVKEMNEILPDFIPERDKTLRFFKKLKLKEPIIFETAVFNVNKRADECVKRYNSGKTYHDHRDKLGINEYIDYDDVLPCGHSELYKCYIDSDKCMMCDYLKIKND